MDDGLTKRIQELERELDALPEPKQTWFLDPARATDPRLGAQIAAAASSQAVRAILETAAGAVAVLNEQRQVVALNAGYLRLLGVTDPEPALGLRFGETIRCTHANDSAPGGCGTGPACRTCGAAVSMLAAAELGAPSERDCALALERDGALVDAEFRVRVHPLDLPPERFLLLSLVDVSAERRRAALERAFFHDLGQMLRAVVEACDAMEGGAGEVSLAIADARDVAARVAQELELQRALLAPVPTGYRPTFATIPVGGVVDALEALFLHHPVAEGKRLRVTGNAGAALLQTDPYLLQHVLSAMLVNAFEASPALAEVALRADAGPGEVAFRVWNPGVIAPSVAPRIFQRYFTTRPGEGRGHGTFVMKHFGEKVLRGRVSFTSTREAGTTFELRIPRTLRS